MALTDNVYTPTELAIDIIKHFQPEGKILDAFKGKGAFYDNIIGDKDWCEIDEGRDFFNYNKHVNYIITNPPYSIYEKVMEHSFEIADNIIYLIPIGKIFSSQRRIRQLYNWGGIKEIYLIPTKETNFPFGFPVGAVHFQKGYNGPINMTFKKQK